MSIITKEEFISYVKEGKNKSWDKIIRAYCEEFDKEEKDIDNLLSVLPLVPLLLYQYYDIAQDYFFTKFEVIILVDKDKNIKDIY